MNNSSLMSMLESLESLFGNFDSSSHRQFAAFTNQGKKVFAIGDVMDARGWHLDVLDGASEAMQAKLAPMRRQIEARLNG